MNAEYGQRQLKQLGDDQLLKLISNCDADAWGELVSRHANAVFSLALTITHDHSLAGDAVQETFLIARKSAEGFRYGNDARSWLLKIASREALRLARRRTRDQRRMTEEMELNAAMQSTQHNPELDLEQQELMNSLRNAMDKLPMILRSTVALRFFAGMTQAEIAKELKCERSTVSTRISQALARLRSDLGPVHGAQVTLLLPALCNQAGPSTVPAILQQKLAQIGTMRPSQLLKTVHTQASQRSAAIMKSVSAGPSFIVVLSVMCLALGIAAYFLIDETAREVEQETVIDTEAAAPIENAPNPTEVLNKKSTTPRVWSWQFNDGLPKEWIIADPRQTLQWQEEAFGQEGIIRAGNETALAVLPVDLSRPFVVRYRWRPSAAWQTGITVDHPTQSGGLPARKNWQASLALPPRLQWAEYEHYFLDGWMISRLRIGKKNPVISRISHYQLSEGAQQYQQTLMISNVLLADLEIQELTASEIRQRVGDPEQQSKKMKNKPQEYAAGMGSFAVLFEELAEIRANSTLLQGE